MGVSRISEIRPAPTVLPPSRMAKRMVFSMATGVMSSTSIGDVVAGHDHFDAFGELDRAGHVRGAEVELRAVVGEERRVTAALFLREDVDLRLELLVRLDRAGLGDDHAALDVVLLGAAEQQADVVAGARLVEELAEHFDVGDGRLGRGADADELDFFHLLEDAALDTTGGDGAATFNVEHVFHRHEEGLIDRALGHRDVFVHGVHEFHGCTWHRRGSGRRRRGPWRRCP